MASGTINLGTSGYLQGQIVWSSYSNGSSANSSNVTASLQVRRTNSYTTTGTWTGNLNIGGNNQSYSIHTGVSNSWVTLKSFSTTISHNSNGQGSCYIQGKVNAPSGTSLAGKSLSAESTVGLDTIPRYANVIEFKCTKQSLTSADFEWKLDSTCSIVKYKINNGSYITLATNAMSGVSTITGFEPNTKYNITLNITRSDSGLSKDGSTISFTTKDIARITSANNFNIGTNPTIKFNNPSGSSISVYMEMDSSNTNISNGTFAVTGKTEYTFTNVNNAKIYQSIPNATSKQIRFVIKTSVGNKSYYHSVTKTASVTNSNPTVGSFTYKDSNSNTTNITGNNQRIVRNQSNLQFIIGSATGKNYATISKYEVTLNGVTKSITSAGTIDFGKINLSYSESAKLVVTDSRGNTASKTLRITIDDWTAPIGAISLRRKNNYEAESYLIVDGTYSSVNSKNAMTITYQTKKVSEANYSGETTIKDNSQVTLNLDNTLAWNVKIKVTDKFQSTTYDLILPIGKPIVFVDVVTQKLGINCFPTSNGERVQIEGSLKATEKIIGKSVNNYSYFPITGASGKAKWVHLGKLRLDGDSQNTIIKVYTGDGYNGRANQNAIIEIMIKNGWQQTQSATTSFGVLVFLKGENVKNAKVDLRATAHNLADVWVYLPWTYWNGYYSIEGQYQEWTANQTTSDTAPTSGTTQNVIYHSELLSAYPVGAIYMSVNTTSPATLFGGTWERIKGRFLLGADDGTYKNGATGGEATHKLSINEMPRHNHQPMLFNDGVWNWSAGTTRGKELFSSADHRWAGTDKDHTYITTDGITYTGGDQAHNNMPPYLVVYIWKRTG